MRREDQREDENRGGGRQRSGEENCDVWVGTGRVLERRAFGDS